MKVAYVDTSALVAIVFGERGGTAAARWLGEHDEIFSANFLEAELRAAYAREGVAANDEILNAVSWALPHSSHSTSTSGRSQQISAFRHGVRNARGPLGEWKSCDGARGQSAEAK